MTSASPPARRRCWAVMVLAGTVLLVAACAGESGDGALGGEVAPFADIQASELSFEADPGNPERGIFRVETTEPAICAIVWGETEALGNFNNSLSMNGTGITSHDVFLPGAIPGRTYFFQVQGSTADGTLYRSPTETFTIPASGEPAADGSVDPRDNLAFGARVVDVSSEFSDSFAGGLAIDDSGTTEWSSDGDGDDAFITLDLGAARQIAAVEFLTRSMLDGSATTETFTVTLDDGRVLGPFPAGSPGDPRPAPVDDTARIVRFDVDSSTGGNTGAVEVRVLAP
jgi:hypothetical protein